MKGKDMYEILLYVALILIMVASLNLAVIDSTGMEMPFARMIVITLTAVLCTAAVIKLPAVLLVALLGGCSGAAYVYYKNPSYIWNAVGEAAGFFNWLYGYIVGYNFFEERYSLVFAVLYIILVTLIVSSVAFSGRGGFLLIVLGTAAMTFFWFIYVQRARLYLMLFLFGSVMLYSYQRYKARLKEWRQSGSIVADNVKESWLVSSALCVVVSIILALALPLNISPVKWDWLNNKVVSLFPFVADWRNDAWSNRSFTGYKGGKLGGELLQDTSVMLTIRADAEENFYLRGSVKDKYNGYSWSKARRDIAEYSQGSVMKVPYSSGVSSYERRLVISHNKLLTSTLFVPFSPYQVWSQSGRIYTDESGEVYSSKMVEPGQEYTVISLLPYIDIDRIRSTDSMRLGSLERSIYLQLPGNISDRVRALSEELTKDCGNNYDKAKAIEKYLRSSYSYTLKPSEVPKKREFTDYFLFEGKEGYCTYYATSMVVLLRIAGIPARYVEGFISIYEGSDVREVRGTNAHAWVEAYFDDYGWITFEPTPEYPVFEYIKPDTEKQQVSSEYEGIKNNRDIGITDSIRRRGQLEDEGGNPGTKTAVNSLSEKGDFSDKVIFGFFIILVLRILYMLASRVVKEIKLEKSRGIKFAMAYIEDVLWYLRKAGFVSEPQETLREFMDRVKHNYNERLTNIAYITDIMEKIRYGKQELSEDERKALEDFRKCIRKLAMKKSGIIGFYTSLYITGR